MRRSSGDDGVVVIEFALVLPILLMLILGLVSGATAWNQNLAIGHGARVAGRQASTVPLPTTVDAVTMAVWLDAVADRTIAASEGALDDGVDGRTVCVAYVDPKGAAPDVVYQRTVPAAGARTSASTPCAPVDATADRQIQVVVARGGVLDTGIYRYPLSLRRTAVYRFEAFVEL